MEVKLRANWIDKFSKVRRSNSKLLCTKHTETNLFVKASNKTILYITLSRSTISIGWVLGKLKIINNCSRFNHFRHDVITTQRYTQIVTGRYARCVYLVFVFTMLIYWEWNNIAENSYFNRNWQNGKEINNPCSQKCPNPSRKTQVQILSPIFRTAFITHLLHLYIDFLHAM